MKKYCNNDRINLCGNNSFVPAFFITLIFIVAISSSQAQNGFWLKCDFHIHTTMSDGDIVPSEIAENAFEKYDLDFIAITDHGGNFFRVTDDFIRTDDKGNPFPFVNYNSLIATDAKRFKNYSRTLQLLEKSFPEVIRLRKKYPEKLIVQGIEFNVPGHEHACVGMLCENAIPLSDFHYIFDRSDTLYKSRTDLKKQNASSHKNALVALSYLQSNYPDESYFIVNHPSRKMQYTISEIRDFNNAAQKIAVGFEGLPGHQKYPKHRCEYIFDLGDGVNYHSKTYGGADFMLAKVGGVWDALLGEGRRFWVFANSDFHRPGEDSWPGEYAKSYLWSHKKNYKSFLQGLHSGKTFAVIGDLINDLKFTAEAGLSITEMGGLLKVKKDSIVTLKIGFNSPTKNNNGDTVHVDHIDLICGDVLGIISSESAEYNTPLNSSTKILKRFSSKEFKKENDGLYYASYSLPLQKSQYFRLRGTNVPVNTKNETDENGNPLCDVLMGDNNEKDAWQDLWFYSNPIFVEVKK